MSTKVINVDGVNKQYRDNYGYLFKNQRKTQETQPDCTGEVRINGVWYWVGGWTNLSRKPDKNGFPRKYLKLSFLRKTLQQGRVDRVLDRPRPEEPEQNAEVA
jgi:hypothetical protein